MVRILNEKPPFERKAECSLCCKILAYSRWDVGSRIEHNTTIFYIECPHCKEEVYINMFEG